MDPSDVFQRPLRTYSRAQRTAWNTRQNIRNDFFTEINRQTATHKEDGSNMAKDSDSKQKINNTNLPKITKRSRVNVKPHVQHGQLKQGKQSTRKPSVIGMKKAPVLQHKTLSSKESMKADNKVAAWMEKSSKWMKKMDDSPYDMFDSDRDDGEPSIEIMRGEENISGVERRKKLFSGLDFHTSCAPVKPDVGHDMATAKKGFFESLDLSRKLMKKTKTRDDTPATSRAFMTCSQLTDNYQTGTTMDTCDDITEETVTGDVGRTDASTSQSSATIQLSQTMQDMGKSRKYLCSTARADMSVTPKFPELSAITKSDHVTSQKAAETTPKQLNNFKVPQSPSKNHHKNQRRGKLDPKHSTELFTTGCVEIMDAFSSISPILPICTIPSQQNKSRCSPEIVDLQVDVQHNEVMTSTPNRTGKQANLNGFEVDLSSVEVDSGDEDLQIKSSRLINSEEIIHLSDIMVEPDEGPLCQETDKKTSPGKDKQLEQTQGASKSPKRDLASVSKSIIGPEILVGKESAFDPWEKVCKRMRRIEKLLVLVDRNNKATGKKNRLQFLNGSFTMKKRLGKQNLSRNKRSKKIVKHENCTLMSEKLACQTSNKFLIRGREILPTDYHMFIKTCPEDDLL